MKKTKLTALVCAAALAMSMPASAFAADSDAFGVYTEGNVPAGSVTAREGGAITLNPEKGGAGTQVDMEVYVSKINVDVPLKITAKLDAAGGDAQVPDNYKIVNHSQVPVKVSNAKVLSGDSKKIRLVGEAEGDITTWWGALKDGSQIAPVAVENATKGTMAVPFAINASGVNVSWLIKEASKADSADGTGTVTPVELPLTITMKNTPLTQTYFGQKAENVATVVYTIEANGQSFADGVK